MTTIVSHCHECPKCLYYGSGKSECTGVSGRGGPKFVPNKGVPEWCPLTDPKVAEFFKLTLADGVPGTEGQQ